MASARNAEVTVESIMITVHYMVLGPIPVHVRKEMSPEQKIKRAIILRYYDNIETVVAPEITQENVDECFEELNQNWLLQDDIEEFRSGEVETDIPCEWSRNYESKSVAAKTPDGWVGWTYWFGGGKHAEPSDIDWMNVAYDLDVHEEEKLVIVRTFKKTTPCLGT